MSLEGFRIGRLMSGIISFHLPLKPNHRHLWQRPWKCPVCHCKGECKPHTDNARVQGSWTAQLAHSGASSGNQVMEDQPQLRSSYGGRTAGQWEEGLLGSFLSLGRNERGLQEGACPLGLSPKGEGSWGEGGP